MFINLPVFISGCPHLALRKAGNELFAVRRFGRTKNLWGRPLFIEKSDFGLHGPSLRNCRTLPLSA
jgi:hypothetical protein